MAIENAEETAFVTHSKKVRSYSNVTEVEADVKIIDDTKKAGQKQVGTFDTKAKKFIITCIAMYSFIMSCAYSMLAPFFPGEVFHFHGLKILLKRY